MIIAYGNSCYIDDIFSNETLILLISYYDLGCNFNSFSETIGTIKNLT